MAYNVWTVVFGELPTAAKWNQLGTNDAGFRDGSNLQINNNQDINWRNVADDANKGVIKLGADDILRLSQLRVQLNTTNSTKEDILIQSGWGFILGDDSEQITEVVTFPTAFDTILTVVVGMMGRRGSDPADITELNANPSSTVLISADGYAPTTTGFTARIHAEAANTLGSSLRWGYTWIAIGAKA